MPHIMFSSVCTNISHGTVKGAVCIWGIDWIYSVCALSLVIRGWTFHWRCCSAPWECIRCFTPAFWGCLHFGSRSFSPVVALFFLSPHSVAVLLVSCVTSHLLFHFRQRGAVHRVSLHFYMNQNWLLRSAANRSCGHFHWRKITAGRICGLRPPIVVQFVSTGVSVFDFGPKDLMVDCWFHPFDTNTSF